MTLMKVPLPDPLPEDWERDGEGNPLQFVTTSASKGRIGNRWEDLMSRRRSAHYQKVRAKRALKEAKTPVAMVEAQTRLEAAEVAWIQAARDFYRHTGICSPAMRRSIF